MKFLAAHWKHLLIANYVVEPNLLEPFRPAKTKIDLFEGFCFVSLVAFLFDQTRVLGLPIPMHQRFEEVNLRFYVVPDRDPSLRAVTFIREIVPRRAIPWIANSLFNENYISTPMSHRFEPADPHENGVRLAEYSWGKNLEHRLSARIENSLGQPAAGSLSEFITEHYWGYAKSPTRTLEYRVEHPQWNSCLVDDYQIDVDFEKVYGKEFGFMNHFRPASFIYALGSPVTVSFPARL